MDTKQPDCQPCHHFPPEARPSSIVVTSHDNQSVFRSMKPIENRTSCVECHDPNDRILGVLVTDISMIPLETTLADSLWEHIRWGISTILVTVLIVNLVLSRFVLKRLEGLATAIAGLGEGFLPPPLPTGQADEIGQLATAFNIMSQQIETRETENQKLSANLRRESRQRGELLKRLISTQEDERKRIARELHDELGQSLTGLELRAGALKQIVTEDPSRAQSQLEEIQTLVTETTDRMYNLILDLRPSVLDDLGLAAALKFCADRVLMGSGISFVLNSDELPLRVHPTLETTVYRIFQEALNNVVRHAQATQVRVNLIQRNGVFECTIADNGQGFDPQAVQFHHYEPRGLGLLGMQERMAQCGGRLEIVSQPGGGTRLIIHVPLKEMPCD
jgi:signal transduction histidine kinase